MLYFLRQKSITDKFSLKTYRIVRNYMIILRIKKSKVNLNL